MMSDYTLTGAHPEALAPTIRDRIFHAVGGLRSVQTLFGKIDLLTPSEVIVIAPLMDWQAGLKRVILCGGFYPDHSCRLHLFGQTNPWRLDVICTIAFDLGVGVTFETDDACIRLSFKDLSPEERQALREAAGHPSRVQGIPIANIEALAAEAVMRDGRTTFTPARILLNSLLALDFSERMKPSEKDSFKRMARSLPTLEEMAVSLSELAGEQVTADQVAEALETLIDRQARGEEV